MNKKLLLTSSLFATGILLLVFFGGSVSPTSEAAWRACRPGEPGCLPSPFKPTPTPTPTPTPGIPPPPTFPSPAPQPSVPIPLPTPETCDTGAAVPLSELDSSSPEQCAQCPSYGFTGKVSLAWDAPPSNPRYTLQGYNVYHGEASGVYHNPIGIGKQTSYTFDGLTVSTMYYFAVTAMYTDNDTQVLVESGYSNEVKSYPRTPALQMARCTNRLGRISFKIKGVSSSDIALGVNWASDVAGPYTNTCVLTSRSAPDTNKVVELYFECPVSNPTGNYFFQGNWSAPTP